MRRLLLARVMVLKVNEIFKSIQGESSHAGRPCTFVRLTGCNLRCAYCDTTYAYDEGREMSVEEVLSAVAAHQVHLVEITGGEPLLQAETPALAKALLDRGFAVLVETNGSKDISALPAGCVRIMDLKCPSSGMKDQNLWSNLEHLAPQDEVKFVMGSREDYEWAKHITISHDLAARVTVLFSTVFGTLGPQRLVEWVLRDGLPVRFQIQMQKYIWSPEKRGV